MISFNGIDMKLTITSASTSYSGTYKVVVSNEFGQDESSARLVVEVRNRKMFGHCSFPCYKLCLLQYPQLNYAQCYKLVNVTKSV